MSVFNDFNAMRAHCGSGFKTFTKIMFFASLMFRISNVLYRWKLVPLSRMFWLINRILFSIDIDPRATIKGGLVMLHGAGIVIGKSVKIMGDVKIYQGVTLGGNSGKVIKIGNNSISQPILEQNIIIGINAVVIGPISIGEGVNIGANSVITKDVPAFKTVVSNNKIVN